MKVGLIITINNGIVTKITPIFTGQGDAEAAFVKEAEANRTKKDTKCAIDLETRTFHTARGVSVCLEWMDITPTAQELVNIAQGEYKSFVHTYNAEIGHGNPQMPVTVELGQGITITMPRGDTGMDMDVYVERVDDNKGNKGWWVSVSNDAMEIRTTVRVTDEGEVSVDGKVVCPPDDGEKS
jgi:hypothetical protein